MCVTENWDWGWVGHDEDTRNTRLIYLKLLDDFREDTPEFIIDLFKRCVTTAANCRAPFKTVISDNFIQVFIFLRTIFNVIITI